MSGRTPNPSTALICTNDLIATGVVIGAQSRRFAIPARISAVGIDNPLLFEYTCPPRITVDIPATEIGMLSANALVGAIEEGKPIGRHQREVALVVRQTTAGLASRKNRTVTFKGF